MPYARDEAGHVWETDTQGNAIRLAQQAGGQVVPANPLKVQGAQADITHTGAQTTGQNIHNQVDAATTQAQIDKANADAQRAQAEAAAAVAAQAGKPNPEAARHIKGLGLDEVLSAIDQARGRVSGWSTGLGGQVLQPIGGTQARDLSGDLSTIASHLTVDKLQDMKAQSQTGASGMGALSEKEGALLRDSVASLDQGQSEPKVQASLDAIEMHYRRLRAIQDGLNPDDPNVQKQYGIPTPGLHAPHVGGVSGGSSGGPPAGPSGTPPGTPPPWSDPGKQMQLSQGSQWQENPALHGVNSHVSDMLHSGKSGDEIRAYLSSVGVDPAKVRNVDEAAAYRKQYPSYRGAYPVNVEGQNVPLSTGQAIMNKLGQSGAGAYAANAADALSMGTLDNMTRNPEMTRALMSGIADQHPLASVLGTMSGGAMAASGLEAAAGAAGLGAIPSMVASDAAYGAGYGAGTSDDGSRLTGALTGALTGVGGGMAGRAVASGVGGLTRGVTDQAKLRLNDAGVRMTIPQLAGGTMKGVEDRLSGLPVVGSIINGERAKGMTDFNRAAFNEALVPIGQQGVNQVGEAGVQQAQDAVSQAYRSALDGVQVRTDAPFKQVMPQVMQQVASAPRVGPELASGMNSIASPMFGPGGTLRGTDAQSILQGLQQFKRGYRTGVSPDPLYATHIAPGIDAYGGQIEGLLQRQAPEVMPALGNANAANRNLSVVQDAVLAAANRDGQFTPAQLMTASKGNAVKFSGRRSAAAGKGSMFGLARAGNEVLPSKVPDSGTAGRLALYGLLGGGYGASDYGSKSEGQRDAVGSASKGLAAALALAGGSKALRPIVQKAAFVPRAKAVRMVGDYLVKHPELGGGALVPLLLPQK